MDNKYQVQYIILVRTSGKAIPGGKLIWFPLLPDSVGWVAAAAPSVIFSLYWYHIVRKSWFWIYIYIYSFSSLTWCITGWTTYSGVLQVNRTMPWPSPFFQDMMAVYILRLHSYYSRSSVQRRHLPWIYQECLACGVKINVALVGKICHHEGDVRRWRLCLHLTFVQNLILWLGLRLILKCNFYIKTYDITCLLFPHWQPLEGLCTSICFFVSRTFLHPLTGAREIYSL